jgi:hypothetical protein
MSSGAERGHSSRQRRMNVIRAKSKGPPEAECTLPARGPSAKGNRSRSGRTRSGAEHQPLAKRGLGAKRQPLLPSSA